MNQQLLPLRAQLVSVLLCPAERASTSHSQRLTFGRRRKTEASTIGKSEPEAYVLFQVKRCNSCSCSCSCNTYREFRREPTWTTQEFARRLAADLKLPLSRAVGVSAFLFQQHHDTHTNTQSICPEGTGCLAACKCLTISSRGLPKCRPCFNIQRFSGLLIVCSSF